MMKVLLVAGARPNFMKVMPLLRQMRKYPKIFKPLLMHTGQHYDFNMSAAFFKDLDIPKPDIYLGVGSATHGAQTAGVLNGVEKVLQGTRFDLVIVVGDVNSTIGAALASVKLGVKVAHVEAGLRSFDRSMPEEINRLLTDQISDYLFTTEDYAGGNLLKEGLSPSKIFFVGDVMIDSFILSKISISRSSILKRLCLDTKGYCLATMHRPSNVDNYKSLKNIANILKTVSRKIKVVFSIHPRTRKMLKRYRIALKGITTIDPLGYVDFHRLLEDARFVITDSGGMQQETTFLDIPCLTARDTTERPITIKDGTNELTGTNKKRILKAADIIMDGGWKKAKKIKRWDGKASERIINILLRKEKEICSRC